MMISIWQMYRGSGMGVGHLPDAGGAMDQPAIMIDAFNVMDDQYKELTNGPSPGTSR